MTPTPTLVRQVTALAQSVIGAIADIASYQTRYHVAFVHGFPAAGSVAHVVGTGELLEHLLDPWKGGLPFQPGSPRQRILTCIGLSSGGEAPDLALGRAQWLCDLLRDTFGEQVLDNVDVLQLDRPRPGASTIGPEHPENRGVAVVLAVDHPRPRIAPSSATKHWEIDFTGTVTTGHPVIDVLSGFYMIGTLRNVATDERRMIRFIGVGVGVDLALQLPATLSVNLFPQPHPFTTADAVDLDDFDGTDFLLVDRSSTLVVEISSETTLSFPELGAVLELDNVTVTSGVSHSISPTDIGGYAFVGDDPV